MTPTSAPRVGVVMLNYNGITHVGKEPLLKNLGSVLDNEYPNFQVAFADNGSKDSSVDVVRRRFGKRENLEVVRLRRNWGVGGGLNRAVKRLQPAPEYLFFLNTDTRVPKTWLTDLVRAFEENPEAAVVGPTTKSPTGEREESLLYMDSTGTLRPALRYLTPKPLLDREGTIRVSFVQGSAIGVRTSAFSQLGGFDDYYLLYYNDTDLCARVWQAGHSVIIDTRVEVEHHGSQTIKKAKSPEWIAWLLARNRLYFIVKMVPARRLLKAAMVYAGRVLVDAATTDVATRRAVVGGALAGLLDLDRALARRSRSGRRPLLIDVPLGSLVLQSTKRDAISQAIWRKARHHLGEGDSEETQEGQ